MTRREYIEAARAYTGTPYHHAARVKGVGVDCVGLLCCAARDIGYQFTDALSYSRTATGFRLLGTIAKYLDRNEIGAQQPGDIGLFWIDPNHKRPQHACIFTDYRGGVGMIHAWENAGRTTMPRGRRGTSDTHHMGSVVEHSFVRFWQKRLCRVFSLRDVEPWPH